MDTLCFSANRLFMFAKFRNKPFFMKLFPEFIVLAHWNIARHLSHTHYTDSDSTSPSLKFINANDERQAGDDKNATGRAGRAYRFREHQAPRS